MQKYHRAYKACLRCRKRKTKCIISADEHAAGRPCLRCRRTMHDCTFNIERSAPKDNSERAAATPRVDSEEAISLYTTELLSIQQHGQTAFRGDSDSEPQSITNQAPLPHQASPFDHAILPEAPDRACAANTASDDSTSQESAGFEALTNSVLKTTVARCDDYLEVLSNAAQCEFASPDFSQEQNNAPDRCWRTVPSTLVDNTSNYNVSPQSLHITCTASKQTKDIWKCSPCVRKGWLSVEEAIALVDSFFLNLLPHAPILDNFFQDHSNHDLLVKHEPFLCCVILTVSSHYHYFPAAGGRARSELVHTSLWKSCQKLLLLLMLGQQKCSNANIRTVDSVAAILLLIEWHPQALDLHDNPEDSDSDAPTTWPGSQNYSETTSASTNASKWFKTIIGSSRQSHRMAGMMLNCAMALAEELEIFQRSNDRVPADTPHGKQYVQRRRASLAKVIYVYQQHTSARLGSTAQGSHNVVPFPLSCTRDSGISNSSTDQEWDAFMAARIELAKIVTSSIALVVPSALVISELIQSGRYVSILDHFEEMLNTWGNKHLDGTVTSNHFQEILKAEYHTCIIGTLSIALQAVVDRTLAEIAPDTEVTHFHMTDTDKRYTEAIIDSCMEIFRVIIRLAETRRLVFAPENLFVRLTMACVLLMKALGLGVTKIKFDECLGTLAQVIAGLDKDKMSELQLGHQYTSLLGVCMKVLRTRYSPQPYAPSLLPRAATQLGLDELEQAIGQGDELVPPLSPFDLSLFHDCNSEFNLTCLDGLTIPLWEPHQGNEEVGEHEPFDDNLFQFW